MSRTRPILTLLTLTAAAAGLLGCSDGVKQATDLPPQVTNAYAEDGVTINLVNDETIVWVQVYDEDMASVTYQWFLSEWGQAPAGSTDENPEGSEITLEWDKELDGQTLSLLISDVEHSTRLDWPLTVQD